MPDLYIRLEPDTKSQCRGRNGWFKPAVFAGYHFEHVPYLPFQVQISSAKANNHAPINLWLTEEDLVHLFFLSGRLLLRVPEEKPLYRCVLEWLQKPEDADFLEDVLNAASVVAHHAESGNLAGLRGADGALRDLCQCLEAIRRRTPAADTPVAGG